jgi:antitoxin component of MazEF toxin-antitoxin module
MKVVIKRWGTGLAVRLPDEIARAAKLREGDAVNVEVVDGRVVIEAKPEAKVLEFASRKTTS